MSIAFALSFDVMLSALWIITSLVFQHSPPKCHIEDGPGADWSLRAIKWKKANFGTWKFILLDGSNGY